MKTIRQRQVASVRSRDAWRAERQASQERCQALLDDLPPITPGSMHELCAAIRTPDGRPVRVHPRPIPPHGPAALLVPFDDEYVILVDETTSGFPRWRQIAHEAGHAAAGHCKGTMPAADQRALLFPDLDPGFVKRALALTPGYYPTQQERDAEALGGRLLAAVMRGRAHKQAKGTLGMELVPLPGRRDALYRQFWRLRRLWVELVTAVPGAALYPPSSFLADLAKISDLDNRVVRQAIEILDVRRLLQDWLDQEVGSTARERACRAGLPDRHVDAAAEAAMLAAAAQAVRHARVSGRRAGLAKGNGNATPPTPGGVACAASVKVHAELARLELVAAAFTGPIVRATLSQHNL